MVKDAIDVIIVGGGPSGSVMAWSLASKGLRVVVVERSKFPREKVCGDFVEPAGLRLLDTMGCLQSIQTKSPLAITHVTGFVQTEQVFKGKIPYFQDQYGMPPHGYIVPRKELDMQLLNCAVNASAKVCEGSVKGVSHDGKLAHVRVKSKTKEITLSAPLVVGADGVEISII